VGISAPVGLDPEVNSIQAIAGRYEALADDELSPDLLGLGWGYIIVDGLAFAGQLRPGKSPDDKEANKRQDWQNGCHCSLGWHDQYLE
jgi:hypothetical protein